MSLPLKNRLTELLSAPGGIEEASTMAASSQTALRTLIGMTYDKSSALSWRAMDAIGRAVSRLTPERARNITNRILWMMREESGTDPWSSAEIISEILSANHKPVADIIPILITFHEEPIFRAGSLRGLMKLSPKLPEVREEFGMVPLLYLADPDPQVRGYAALAALATGAARTEEGRAAIKKLVDDNAPFLYYDNDALERITVGDAAGRAS